LDNFLKHETENVENTDFFKFNYPPMGSFYENAEFKTRVVVMNQDDKELHDAHEAARHLADRHDLRFGYSSDLSLMRAYDKKHNYLTRNFNKNGAFEALISINHQDEHVQMGLHPRHNKNQEQSIKEFVNRESVSILDDLNSDTILTLGMLEVPLLLSFVDLELW